MSKDSELKVDLIEIISNSDMSKEQKEDTVLSWLNLTRDQATVVWDNGKISHVKLIRSMETVNITITIDKDDTICKIE